MLELDLAPQDEAQADPHAPDYDTLHDALGNAPLYHQWRTYQELHNGANLLVNSYNTGTGKTKAALLRLLDLSEDYPTTHDANVLFIAPTNELLRQHQGDVSKFITRNNLRHLVLQLDAARIQVLAETHLPDKFKRKGEWLDKMLENPRTVLRNANEQSPRGDRPYILVINPDLFYYALYGLGNPHEQRGLFRHFLKFRYIIVDEFHYYNAKQLANFLFFMALLREFGYFETEPRRQVCLLTATPVPEVDNYLTNLKLNMVKVEPIGEPENLTRIPALAPVHLRLYNADETSDGLVDRASEAKDTVQGWLDAGQHGAFISGALWRINQIYNNYGGDANPRIGRLTGAENREGREAAKKVDLMMATPTVDIGYNFERENWPRQNIDFLLFDARTSDEFIQRLGRAGRVLGKTDTDSPSEAWAVVPAKLVERLEEYSGQTLTRSQLNALVNEPGVMPKKNGIFGYVRSGAIAEAFLPVFSYAHSLPTDQEQTMQRLYDALAQVFDTRGGYRHRFGTVKRNIYRYLALKKQERQLLAEAKESFKLGTASATILAIAQQGKDDDSIPEIDEATAAQDERNLLGISRRLERNRRVKQRQESIEEYFVANAHFQFRDSYEPPQAIIYDPHHLLSRADYKTYSALHVAQYFDADWTTDKGQLGRWAEHLNNDSDDVLIGCEIKKHRQQRLFIQFTLDPGGLDKRGWEDRYCGKLSAHPGFNIIAADGTPLPVQLRDEFSKGYIVFYAVRDVGAQGRALNGLKKQTSLFTNTLKIDFGSEGEHSYLVVLGAAALLVSCEQNVINAAYIAERKASSGGHIFDWGD